MEGSVWTQLFALVVATVSRLSALLTEAPKQKSSISSPNAQENRANSSSTLKSPQIDASPRLQIKRNPMQTTASGVFGDMVFDGKWICFTLENPADLIQPGIYTARLDKSPHLGYVCPHLQVPERDTAAGGDAGLRIHVANWTSQLLGCVAVGLQLGSGCIEQSQAAFDRLMAVLPQEFTVVIE